MKKFSKMFALVMSAVMLFGVMTGCAAADKTPTAESLLKSYQEKVQAAEGMKADCDLDMQMKVSIFGQDEEIKMGGTMNIESSGENAHIAANFKMDTSEDTEDVATEMYVMKEGDKFVEYQCTDGDWTKTSVDGADKIDSMVKNTVVGDPAKFTMETTDTEYVLKGSISMKEAMDALPEGMLDDVMNSAGGGTDMLTEDMFAEMGDVPVEYHFSKETKDIVSMNMDMTDAMQKIMDAAIKQAMSEMGDLEGVEGMEDFDITTMFNFNISAMKINMKNMSFEAVNVTLPDEAKNAVEVSAEDFGSLPIGE